MGDHIVVFAGEGERLTLTHHAEDRALFAYGALKGGALGAKSQARTLFDDGRARPQRRGSPWAPASEGQFDACTSAHEKSSLTALSVLPA